MLKAQLKRSPFLIVAIAILAATTYLIHHSALSGSWRYDDGVHLAFAADYAPWQYFFLPEIARLQSGGSFFTPWNVFFYDINLSLFGLNAKGFYAHQLIVLWLSSVATYCFLRLWVSTAWSLFGAVLFLSNAATVHIAQELMTGHYAAGLLFSIVALYCYVQSIRNDNFKLALAGAFFYFLSVFCKEVYFPLVGILFFIPEGRVRGRLRYALPYSLIALAYIPWRFFVLNGSLGGYNNGVFANISISEIWNVVKVLFYQPKMLLDGSEISYFILLMISVVYFYKRRNCVSLIAVAVALIFVPLVPIWINLGSIDRFHFFLWWAISIYIAIILSSWEGLPVLRYALAGLFLSLSLLTSYGEMYSSKGSKEIRGYHDVVSGFILNSNANQVFYDPNTIWYPPSGLAAHLAEVEKHLYPLSPVRATITSDVNQFYSFVAEGKVIWRYGEQCQCMENINSIVPDLVYEYNKVMVEKALFLNVKYENKSILWNVGPYHDGIYKFVTNEFGVLPLSGATGVVAYDVSKTLSFYLLYKSPEGWMARSPFLVYKPAVDPLLSWARQEN